MTEPKRYRVELTPAARTDLREIAIYIADQRGADAGEALLDAMLERIGTLEHFPFRGSRPKELEAAGESTARQLVFGRFRIVYDVNDDCVSVFLVADGRRDMAALLAYRLLTG